MTLSLYENVLQGVSRIEPYRFVGKVSTIRAGLIESTGLLHCVSIGSRCDIRARDGRVIEAEVIGFTDKAALLMPFRELGSVGMGCDVTFVEEQSLCYPSEAWLGRIINAMGSPVDDKGLLPKGEMGYSFKAMPPPAHKRQRVGPKLDTGVRAINAFTSCCLGQRMGIFAGSGVGKSMLIAMLTRYASTDVKVIGLIGERGREVQEFIQDYLGEEGLSRSVIVVATGDEPALMRRQAAYLTLTIAEYFRDAGLDVLCLMDSVTRFAMAQREIGLSAGEPPTSKGYTPSVFAELPRLLERAGPGVGKGTITGLFSVLVDGDDHNEPVADAVRGILDGHIVMDRAIAERGRFPSIDILRSISRMMPQCNNDQENALIKQARQLLSTYHDMEELIRIGAYQTGSNPDVDMAIHYQGALEEFLSQAPGTFMSLEDGYAQLASVLDIPWGEGAALMASDQGEGVHEMPAGMQT